MRQGIQVTKETNRSRDEGATVAIFWHSVAVRVGCVHWRHVLYWWSVVCHYVRIVTTAS